MLSCLVYLESHPRPKHPTKGASPERASRAEGVFSAARPPRFPIVSAPPLRPVLCAFLKDCSGRASDRWTYPCLSKLFRINTCKSLSKQTTLTLFRSHTYEKQGGGGVLWLTSPLLASAFIHANESTNYPLHVQFLTNCPFFIPFVLIFMHRTGGVGGPFRSILSQRSNVPTFRRCDVPTFRRSYVRPVTCPDDVHPPYYWSEHLPPTNFPRIIVPSFLLHGRV
jgi:hypothetical protein